MSRRRPSALLLGLLVVAVWLVVPWSARAQTSTTTTSPPPAPTDCADQPKHADLSIRYCTLPDHTSNTSTFPLRVEVRNSGGTALRDYLVTGVSLEIVPTLDDQEVPEPATLTWQGSSRSVAVEWAPTFTTNGPYELRIVARGDGPGGQENSVTVPMILAAPPHPPTGVKVGEADDGSIVVTWVNTDREPDVLSYEVRRAAEGSTSSVSVGRVEASSVPRVVDDPGVGKWRYRVTAIRRGASSDGPTLSSTPASGTVEVEPAPSSEGGVTTTTASTTTAAGSGAGTAGGSATTTRPRAAVTTGARNDVDLSRAAPSTGARRPATTVRRVEPDTGFDETLPFDLDRARPEALPEEAPAEVGAPAPQVLDENLISDDGERRRSLGFVAFGLLLFVLGMTGFFLKAEVRRVDELEPVDPDLPVPVAPTLVAASAEPVVDPAEVLEPVDAETVPVSEPVPVVEPPITSVAAPVVAAGAATADSTSASVHEPDPAAAAIAGSRRRRSRTRMPRREPIDVELAGAPDDDHLADLAEAVPAADRRPPGGRVRRTVAPIDAPDLDVPDPAIPAQRPPTTTRTRTTDRARRASTRLPSRPADDRREGGAAVRPRRRRTGQGDRRLPVG